MTIHSIMPSEVIFAGIEQQACHYAEMTVGGVTMQVEQLSLTQAKIVRLLSCRPADYLNPAFAPGTIISCQPSIES